MDQEYVKVKSTVVHARQYRKHRGNGIRQVVHAGFMTVPLATEAAAEHGQKHVVDMKIRNEKEKKEMQDLNFKLANHIERTRKVEAEKKYLKDLLNKAKVEFNVNGIKTSFQEQLDDLKGQLEDNDKELATTKSQNESLKEELQDLRELMHLLEDERDRLRTELETSHNEVARSAADVKRCSQKTGALENQLADSKTRNGILEEQLAELRTKLQIETTQRLNLASRLEMLEEELHFNIDRHNTEVKEYQAMLSKSEKITDFEESWKAEVGSMISDLSDGYDAALQKITAEMEARHAAEIQLLQSSVKITRDVVDVGKSKEGRADMMGKIGEYETQISNMKSKITDLQSNLDETKSGRASDAASHETELNRKCWELEELSKNLQDMSSAKLSLELEIAVYRKLLDAEESRLGMKSVVTDIGGLQSEAEETLANALSLARKITMGRSTTGPVSIFELATDGKYIELEDLTNGPTTMKNWTLTQTLAGGKKYTHKFTDGNVFSSGKMIKIWGSKHGAGQDGVTSSTVDEWASMGVPSTITLIDDQKKECASLVIKINS